MTAARCNARRSGRRSRRPSVRPTHFHRGDLAELLRTAAPAERKYLLERVDDAAVVQLYADGFAELPLKEKTLVWHLYQAAIAGRDIFYDQKYAHNLDMRDVLEAIVSHHDWLHPH